MRAGGIKMGQVLHLHLVKRGMDNFLVQSIWLVAVITKDLHGSPPINVLI
jgi:hypothetical protein